MVTFPFHLYPAITDAQKVKLHKITKGKNERIHYQDMTESEDPVKKQNIVKVYEYDKGHYIELGDEEVKKLRIESKHTIAGSM